MDRDEIVVDGVTYVRKEDAPKYSDEQEWKWLVTPTFERGAMSYSEREIKDGAKVLFENEHLIITDVVSVGKNHMFIKKGE